jgi:predicted cobalt transporter CbtA
LIPGTLNSPVSPKSASISLFKRGAQLPWEFTGFTGARILFGHLREKPQSQEAIMTLLPEAFHQRWWLVATITDFAPWEAFSLLPELFLT